MRITLVAVGSRGDVQPFIAIGQGFKRAGHNVRLATNENFESLVRDHELDFCAITGDSRAVLDRQFDGNYLTRRHSYVAESRELIRLVEADLVSGMLDCLHACRDADLLIVSPLGLAFGYNVAEKLRIPVARAYMYPTTPTRCYPAFAPGPISLGATFNLWTHHAVQQFLWLRVRATINWLRRDALDLPPMSPRDAFQKLDLRRWPHLYCYSPSVVPRPRDWGPWIAITGYAFLETAPDWRPPGTLCDFLDSGPRPVYVGFGSLPSSDPDETTELVTRALASAGLRGVLQCGWGGLSRGTVSDDVFVADDVPHTWLFPRMAAVVHHGGAGTTAIGLRSGIPSVVVHAPIADQPFWAERVAALGVGPAPIPRAELSVQRLAHALRGATSDEAIARRATSLGEKVRAENGVRRAVETIEAHAASLARW